MQILATVYFLFNLLQLANTILDNDNVLGNISPAFDLIFSNDSFICAFWLQDDVFEGIWLLISARV